MKSKIFLSKEENEKLFDVAHEFIKDGVHLFVLSFFLNSKEPDLKNLIIYLHKIINEGVIFFEQQMIYDNDEVISNVCINEESENFIRQVLDVLREERLDD